MGDINLDRSNPNRGVLMLPMGYSRKNPNILIPLVGLDKAELSNLIIAECEKQGLTDKQAGIVVEEAEKEYENRMKVKEAQKELRMRLREIARYPKLKNGGLKPVVKGKYKLI
jgi:hypothetical protein